MKRAPLRVAVTRDEPADGPLHAALRARGLEPLSCPVVREAPPPDGEPLRHAVRHIASYDWMVAGSQRALSALLEAGLGTLSSRLRTAAAGEKTAALLRRAGAENPVVPLRPGAAGLVEALREADRWPGRRVLAPRALEGRSELIEALRLWGAEVDEVVAYRTLERSPAEVRETWARIAPEAVVLASPSAVRALLAAVGAAELRRLALVAAIGATTAGELAALGVAARVPARADFDSVAELLAGSDTMAAPLLVQEGGLR